MKNVFLLLASLLSSHAFGQWESQVGVNLIPAITKSLEIHTEFSKHPVYALNVHAGYTFKTGHTGIVNYLLYDGVSERKTSGAFMKAGVKLYPSGLSGGMCKSRFYMGALLVVSQYDQTALKREMLTNGDFANTYTPISASGVIAFPAISIGFTHRIGNRLMLDWGIQKSFVTRRNDYLGTQNRNYQPGAGSQQSDPYIGYLQGIFALRYRLVRK